jgi:tRNA A37 threonylcarbamoyladenosine dehydratase
MYERIIKLVGEDNFKKIQNTKILLVGVGGVGGFVFESLVRSGFLDITIIDNDKVELSNFNRQLIANNNTLGMSKVNVCNNNAMNINKNIKIKPVEAFLSKNNINILETDYDYIIDACDTLEAKLELIKFATSNNIKIISSMGMGNRVDASRIKITTLDKTNNDPLAKRLRKLVKDNHINKKIKVVCSEEVPIKKGEVNSMITSPGIAGLLITNYIINDIINL